ncbi:MAG: UDP-N-acetylmuramate dehydrogenase [Chloroflexi bacterium]|nr:UDP-N-acetylmuramate dehydrogenase [Chloroflexota bacterium]
MNDKLRDLAATLAQAGLPALVNEPMARHTSFRIGGPADLWVPARRPAELRLAVEAARTQGVPLTVLGGGTNVLIADQGVRGLVITNRSAAGEPQPHSGEPTLWEADCGMPLATLARWAIAHSLAGLEWAGGIPGTLGGAVIGNAGAFGGEMAHRLREITVLEDSGETRAIPAQELDLGYRTSVLKRAARRPILLTARLTLQAGVWQELEALAQGYAERRRATQPPGASAGSIFRNPPQGPAGRWIDQAGLKGERIGDAVVSPLHGNYIVNAGAASAAQVKALMDKVQESVWKRFGVLLEPEIELLGEWN